MKKSTSEFFRLEDRVLFEAAAVAEIVEAAEAAQDNPNANVSEGDRQAQAEKDALKNAPPENPAAQGGANTAPADPSKTADIDAQVEQLIQGEIPATDAQLDADVLAVTPDALEDAPVVEEVGNGQVEVVLNDSGEAISTGKELVIVSESVGDIEQIVASLKPNQEVLLLGSDVDAFGQINEYLLNSETEYQAIHFMTHGAEGFFTLNGQVVGLDSFDAEFWNSIGEHLSDDGDIMLYGCDLAATAEGQLLVDRIAEASGADVAASVDATGLGGNWTLEYRNGVIETTNISVENYAHRLQTFKVDRLDDSSAEGTLRWAVTSPNSDAIAKEIIFDAKIQGKTITLGSSLVLTERLTIYGHTYNVTIAAGSPFVGDSIFVVDPNANVTVTVKAVTLDGNNLVRAFEINTGSLTLNNVSINNTHASADGGAILQNSGTLTMTGVEINNSHADGNGGVLWMKSGTDAVISGITIENVSATDGGAIYNNGKTIKFSGNILIENSSATNNGGVFYNNGSAAEIQILGGGTRTITKASAGNNGGVLYNLGGQFTNSTDAKAHLEMTGEAGNDGGVFYSDGGEIQFGGSRDSQITTAITGIAGKNGGVGYSVSTEVEMGLIRVYEGTALDGNGGAFYAQGGTLTSGVYGYVKGIAEKGNGGAVYIDGGKFITVKPLSGSTFFKDSVAKNGGGMYAKDSTLILQSNYFTITDCLATENGGGLFINGGILAFSGGHIGISGGGNKADKSGGGIYIQSIQSADISGSIGYNEAKKSGGGLFVGGSTSKVFVSGGTVVRNRVTGDSSGSSDICGGGGIYVSDGRNLGWWSGQCG